jgi:hypothetical protein
VEGVEAVIPMFKKPNTLRHSLTLSALKFVQQHFRLFANIRGNEGVFLLETATSRSEDDEFQA